MKIKEETWYGFDHKAVNKQFDGNLTFIGEFSMYIKGKGYHPCAVYKAANPNRELGHKDYMLLFKVQQYQSYEKDSKEAFTEVLYVSGRTIEEMQEERYQEAIICLKCDTLLYSIARHHYHTCGCDNNAMVDGGKDYTRYGAKNMNKIKVVKLDHLTKKVLDKDLDIN